MMFRTLKTMFFLVVLLAALITSSNAYEIPQREIQVKPYLNFLFPNNLLEMEGGYNPINEKTIIGLGLKIRNQYYNHFGLMFNMSINSVDPAYDAPAAGVIFTFGGYFKTSNKLGTIIFDCGYGCIMETNEGMGLLMPSLELSRPVSDRISISMEVGWLIPNDWVISYDFEENYSSFTVSLGSTIIF
ncbi:MAG: hypothetical protein JSV33_15100 [bacterium]|nr:MAG: hypothetical protein JSV33_15100 [bacterium]